MMNPFWFAAENSSTSRMHSARQLIERRHVVESIKHRKFPVFCAFQHAQLLLLEVLKFPCHKVA